MITIGFSSSDVAFMHRLQDAFDLHLNLLLGLVRLSDPDDSVLLDADASGHRCRGCG